jgi:hypothetical protein
MNIIKSIYIREEHYRWIVENDINLSKFVQEAIEEEIRTLEGEKKK